MVFNLFKKPPKIHTGLEISPEGFTLVSLSFEKGGCHLENFICKNFKEEILQNGMITKPDVFAENLKKILEENNFSAKTVNVCVSSNNMFIKTITLPNFPIEELKIIAPQEASKHIPLTTYEINVDFQILENSAKENKIDVILCALSKTIAKNIVDCLAKAELEVESIDVSSFATIRALANAEMINSPDLTYISVLIGYENTDINIIKNGMPIFSHNTQTGKKNIIEAITKSFEINREEAEKRLPEFGLILPGMETSDNTDLHKASNATRSIYSNIASEIQKAIEFHNSQNGENTAIEKIILGGSGVCIQNIDKYITNKLKIQTELCDSLKNISHNLEVSEDLISSINIPALSTSIGLALYSS
jgi:type IV pilus assembly protein PilM